MKLAERREGRLGGSMRAAPVRPHTANTKHGIVLFEMNEGTNTPVNTLSGAFLSAKRRARLERVTRLIRDLLH